MYPLMLPSPQSEIQGDKRIHHLQTFIAPLFFIWGRVKKKNMTYTLLRSYFKIYC